MKWRPLPLKAGLGQLSTGLVERAASAAVAAAEPRIREILQEERAGFAKAAMETLPYAGTAIATFLATMYFVPKGAPMLKGAGYVGSATIGAIGAWKGLARLRGAEKPEPPDETASVFEPMVKGLAQAVVTEAEPKVRALVADERARLGSAGEAALPWGSLAAAGFFSTMYLIPSDLPAAKMAGYTVTTAAALFSVWKALSVVAA